MISYIIKAAVQSNAEEIVLVIGNDLALIEEARSIYSNIKFAYQLEKLGTGHAVKIGMELVSNNIQEVQILYGDTPLIKSETLMVLSRTLPEFDLSVIGFRTDTPSNYGRLFTNGRNLLKITSIFLQLFIFDIYTYPLN